MARKQRSLALSLTALAMLELLFFVWAPFPRSLFDSYLFSFHDFESIFSEIITRSLFYLAFFFVWARILLFLSNGKTSQKQNSKRAWILMLAAQIGIDILRLAVLSFPLRFHWLAIDLLTVLSWLLIVIISKRGIVGYVPSKKNYQVLLLLLLLLFFAFAFFDIYDLEKTKKFAIKYVEESVNMKSLLLNAEFNHQTRNMLLDYLCGITALCFLFHTSPDVAEREQYKIRAQFVLLLRVWIIISACIFVSVLKAAILPISSIGFDRRGFGRSIYYIETHAVSVDTVCISVFRNRADGAQEKVYVGTNCKVYSGNNALFSFHIAGEDSEYSGGKSYGKIDNKSWIVRKHGNTTLNLLNQEYLVWTTDDDHGVIQLESRSSWEGNPLLTFFFEETIKDGIWACPEYSFHYLTKWDNDFIRPYLERYANNSFSQNELSINPEFELTYIMYLAQKELQNNSSLPTA